MISLRKISIVMDGCDNGGTGGIVVEFA